VKRERDKRDTWPTRKCFSRKLPIAETPIEWLDLPACCGQQNESWNLAHANQGLVSSLTVWPCPRRAKKRNAESQWRATAGLRLVVERAGLLLFWGGGQWHQHSSQGSRPAAATGGGVSALDAGRLGLNRAKPVDSCCVNAPFSSLNRETAPTPHTPPAR
jgi:hypothetical protein